ncbi:uncharacterized protein AAEQ78_010273 isoform 2-T2 [Lycaon pictus]
MPPGPGPAGPLRARPREGGRQPPASASGAGTRGSSIRSPPPFPPRSQLSHAGAAGGWGGGSSARPPRGGGHSAGGTCRNRCGEEAGGEREGGRKGGGIGKAPPRPGVTRGQRRAARWPLTSLPGDGEREDGKEEIKMERSLVHRKQCCPPAA